MIEKIEQKQIDDNSVGKLSTRPNAPSAMGGNGLNAAQLRARFDALAKLAIDKINEILASLNGDELKDGTTAPSFASLIKFTGDDDVEYTLEGILDALQNGGFFPVDTEYTPDSNYPQSGKAVNEAYEILRLYTTKYTDAKFNTASILYERVANGLESAEQRIEEVDQQSQQRTEQAKQEIVDYVEEALQDVDVTVDPNYSPSSPNAQSGRAVAQAMKRATDDAAVLCRSTVSTHNTSTVAHNDIRLLISGLQSKINAFFDVSDDNGKIDRLVEIVAYLDSNKELIDAITTSKVSVDAIADNLTTNDSKKVLSAKQGMVLKQEIPLVLPYTIEWKKNEALIAGATGDVQQRYFNRTPQVGDQFSFYCYRAITAGGSIAEKSYHVSAHITVVHTELTEGEDFLVADFVVDKAVLCTHPVDPIYSPDSPNAQSGPAVAQAVYGVQSQIPLVLPYIFKWGKDAPITQGETNTVAAKYFNRIPKVGDRFFGYFYIESIENGEITHKDYHISAKVTIVPENVQPDNAITFVVEEAVQFIPTVDQTYQPTSNNPQSGTAVAQAIADAPKEVQNITSFDGVYVEVASLPTVADEGTTYIVVNGENENNERPYPSLYAYHGTTWKFKAKLKPHTLYCVLTGKNSGIYRYTMSAPYLVLAEQAAVEKAKEYTDQQIDSVRQTAEQAAQDAGTALGGVDTLNNVALPQIWEAIGDLGNSDGGSTGSELIEIIDITELTSMITRDKQPDGTPYSFKSVMAMVSIAELGTYWVKSISYFDKPLYGAFPYIEGNTPTVPYIEGWRSFTASTGLSVAVNCPIHVGTIDINGVVIHMAAYANSNPSQHGDLSGRELGSVYYNVNESKVTKFELSQKNGFPAGTKIFLFGVR